MNARDMAKALGRRGGRMRAQRLSPQRRSQIAALGGRSRARSLAAAQRIADNFRYLAASRALRGDTTKVTRLKACKGPLPGIYPHRP